jgi:hypothetical protein
MESKSIDIKKVAELVCGDSRLIGNYPYANVHFEIGIAPATVRIAPLEIDTGTKTSFANKPNLMMRNSAQIKLPCQR